MTARKSKTQDKPEEAIMEQSKHNHSKAGAMPVVIALLGYGGAIPFMALAGAHLLSLHTPFAAPGAMLVGYGAIILSFVGALHWGSHLRDEVILPAHYIWSIVPALIGWLALMAPLMMAALMLIVGLLLCWWVDRAQIKTGRWPAWMGRLRAHLTLLACLSLSMIFVA